MTAGHSAEPAARSGLWSVAFALALAWSLVAWRSRPPPPLGLDAAPERFSAARAFDSLARVLGDQAPHPSGSAAHAEVRARLAAELEALGLEPELQEAVEPRLEAGVLHNVLARIPGREAGPAHKGVLLVAHYDSVAEGPGAADDGSGVATLLETARALQAGEPLRRDVMLLFTDAEEDGLLGARAFCRGHPWLAQVGVALNFEARGTGGPSMLFQTSGPNRWLLVVARSALARPWTSSVTDLVYNRMPNDTDLTEFIRAGVPGINFAFIDGLSRYHTAEDDLEHLDRGSLQQHGDNALALARAFSGRDLDPPAPEGAAVFFDVLSLAILGWPSGWSLALALGVLLAGCAAWKRSTAALAGVGRGLAWALLAVPFAVVVGSLGALSVKTPIERALASQALSWTLELATWVGVLAALWLLAPRRRHAAAGAEAFFGVLALFALAGLAAAALEPAVSYLFLLPAAAAGLGALVAPRHLERIEVLAILVAGLLWLPIALGLRLSFGFYAPPLVAAPLALPALWLLPAMRRLGRV